MKKSSFFVPYKNKVEFFSLRPLLVDFQQQQKNKKLIMNEPINRTYKSIIKICYLLGLSTDRQKSLLSWNEMFEGFESLKIWMIKTGQVLIQLFTSYLICLSTNFRLLSMSESACKKIWSFMGLYKKDEHWTNILHNQNHRLWIQPIVHSSQLATILRLSQVSWPRFVWLQSRGKTITENQKKIVFWIF